MAGDITSIVGQAVADAGAGDDTGDGASGAADSGHAAEAPVSGAAGATGGADTGAAVSSSAGSATEAAAVPAYTPDDVDTILDKFGFKASPNGEREGRIPHHRVKKLVKQVRDELLAANQAEVKGLTEKLTPAERRAKEFDDIQFLADNHPEQFLQSLARSNPAYLRFLESKVQAAPAPAPAAQPQNDPMPQPDAEFPDGTRGYSTDGLEKRDAWLKRQIVSEAMTQARDEMEKRFGPIAKEYESRKGMEAQVPVLRQKLAAVKETWGPLIDTHHDEIMSALAADNQRHDQSAVRDLEGRVTYRVPYTPFELLVSKVLVPKMQAGHQTELEKRTLDHNAVRASVLKEINTRPAAASGSVPAAAAVGGANGNQPRAVEDIVRDSIRGLA